ncbi:MAG: 30S ribosomal protein S9 [Candidatus Beckwithbacteria bacterium]|nr:30S ribosomal protein S9 [Patescibacteria group bacterium]
MPPKYIYATGRRKRAIARVRLFTGKGEHQVNDMPVAKYFPGAVNLGLFLEPFKICDVQEKYHVTIKVLGSGKSSQLDAAIHGIARTLIKVNQEKFKSLLRKKGLVTRDPRKRERRKAGMGGSARRQRQSPKR